MKKTITTITNTRNNEEFVSMEEAINISLDGTQKEIRILKRADGTEKEVSLSTFKRWYKVTTTEVEVEDPKPEVKPMTKHQSAALRNIRGAYNDTIGGLENAVQDGNTEELPPLDEMFEMVYTEATTTSFQMLGGMSLVGGPAPSCMRFAGKKFIREQIAKLFRKDGYEVPEELLEVPEKKSGHSNIVDGERVNLREDGTDKMVTVRAFTGMLIGHFNIDFEDAETISVTTAKGIMIFSKADGKQTNAANPKYANRIEM